MKRTMQKNVREMIHDQNGGENITWLDNVRVIVQRKKSSKKRNKRFISKREDNPKLKHIPVPVKNKEYK